MLRLNRSTVQMQVSLNIFGLGDRTFLLMLLPNMDTLCFGSINIDHQYTIEHFVRPGETLACQNYQISAGGKGLNQSIALARAGAEVLHAGSISEQDGWLLDLLAEDTIDTRHIASCQSPTGHAIIQINSEGENCILLHGGANHAISESQIDSVLETRPADSWILLQNEINNLPVIVRKARERGLKIALNPAPMDPSISDLPLAELDLLIVNETEIMALSGLDDPNAALDALGQRYKLPLIILTKGARGSVAMDASGRIYQQDVGSAGKVVDTTAAGDCYIGYFLASYAEGQSIQVSMGVASQAAAIAVTRPGAVSSIPLANELVV